MDTLLYRVQGPSAWAEPPSSCSYTSLTSVERCPRQWQLLHSRYGNLDRFPARPNPAAVEGDIVHHILDRLFRTLAVRGMPAQGTAAFREGVGAVDIHNSVRRLVEEHEGLVARHPRGGGFRLRAGPQQLANRVVRLFRELYAEAITTYRATAPRGPVARAPQGLPSGPALLALLRERGALSELTLTHPGLTFFGTLDLVWSDRGTAVIADFKTGQVRPEHKKQIAYYSILWWRCSGSAPGRAEVRYPGRMESLVLNTELLAEIEGELTRRIAAAAGALRLVPAEARLGEHCRQCDVRQFCDPYWGAMNSSALTRAGKGPRDGPLDLEVTVAGEPSASGFDALAEDGESFPVVLAEDLGRLHGPFVKGEALRILGGSLIEGGAGIELKPWTEVFHRTPAGVREQSG
jgi:hypothetical protein